MALDSALPKNRDYLVRGYVTERRIARLLKHHPHPNICTIYDVTEDHLDVERLDPQLNHRIYIEDPPYYTPNVEVQEKIVEAMTRAKEHMQHHRIMYMDWKYDNIGRAVDGLAGATYKLFDFDSSGISTEDGQGWEIEPTGYAYDQLRKRMPDATPQELDDAAFAAFANRVEERRP